MNRFGFPPPFNFISSHLLTVGQPLWCSRPTTTLLLREVCACHSPAWIIFTPDILILHLFTLFKILHKYQLLEKAFPDFHCCLFFSALIHIMLYIYVTRYTMLYYTIYIILCRTICIVFYYIISYYIIYYSTPYCVNYIILYHVISYHILSYYFIHYILVYCLTPHWHMSPTRVGICSSLLTATSSALDYTGTL